MRHALKGRAAAPSQDNRPPIPSSFHPASRPHHDKLVGLRIGHRFNTAWTTLKMAVAPIPNASVKQQSQ